MEKGLVHLYYGDGKGKTSCATGALIRACGAGMSAFVYQFLKNSDSSEICVLEKLDNVTVQRCPVKVPFLLNADSNTKENTLLLYKEEIKKITSITQSQHFDFIMLDEIVDAWNMHFIETIDIKNLLKVAELGTEIVITGHESKERDISELVAMCDYVSYIKKIKHPFDRGVCARKGIEF